jgi:Putative beta barrel porin-7 (BBP7)
MCVRSWPGTWMVLGVMLLATRTFGGDRNRSPDDLPSPEGSWLADDAPYYGATCSSAACGNAPNCNTSCCDQSCYDMTPCCGESCCDVAACCDCCSPLWTVQAGAIFLRRDHQTDLPLANGATPISVADLAFHDYQGGPLVTFMRHSLMGTDTSLEVTYFGVQSSNSASSAGATSVFTVPAINFGANTVTADYRSQLDSTEINLRDPLTDWLTVLAGFRWVELSDDLSTDIGGLATHNVNVNNHLYGAQIGAEIVIWRRDRLSIDWFGKAGIYGSSADQTTTNTGIAGAVPRLSASGSQTAFLGEMDLSVRYKLTEHLSVLGGYRAIWLDGIALAPNQLAVSNIATGAARLDDRSQPIYHGFTVAAELIW